MTLNSGIILLIILYAFLAICVFCLLKQEDRARKKRRQIWQDYEDGKYDKPRAKRNVGNNYEKKS